MLVPREFLSTYLNDHLAGAQAALEILSALRELGDSDEWRRVEAEIAEDRQVLEALVHKTSSDPSTLRRAAAWTAQKLADLKLRVEDPSNGAFRRLELIETLAIGIDGKEALWTALQRISEMATELGSVDYTRLIARAQAQRQFVEAKRLEAAAVALVG
jgi:hypothetical protein